MVFFHNRVATFAFIELLSLADAFQLFTNAYLPGDVSSACANALVTNLTCNPIVSAFQPANYYNQALLQTACVDSCNQSLTSWQSTVYSACTGVTYPDVFNQSTAIQTIPDLLRYNYDQTCRMNTGRYCNFVIGQAANSSVGGAAAACDVCVLKSLQYAAGSPYYDGPLLQASSVYQSYTLSCKVTGTPLTTSTLGYTPPSTTSSAPASPTCNGKTYAIKANDDCHSISISQSIGTMWLLTDNKLQAYCHGFPTAGNLCIVNTCSVYTVKQSDTCDSIAAAYSISDIQLEAWNPAINIGCSNLNSSVGSQICVDEPGPKYVIPSTSFAAVTRASTAAPAPTDLAQGTNPDCGLFYQAVAGDYCNLLVLKFGISLADFTFLNPAINANCTNLYAAQSYCVRAVGDINTYSGRPGYGTATPTYANVPFSSFAAATYVPMTVNATGLPFAPMTRTDCNSYIDGIQYNDTYSSDCAIAAGFYGVSLDDFGSFNPSLGNASAPNCTLNPAYRYCAVLVGVMSASAPPSTPDPIRAGASPNCTAYYDVPVGLDCQGVLANACLTIAQFYAYNSAVNADCSGLWPAYQYCIRTPDYVDHVCNVNITTTTSGAVSLAIPSSGSQTRTATITPTTAGPPAAKLSGQPANCNAWYTIKSGDTCATVEKAYLISSAQFLSWNPAVSADCATGFWLGYSYCVGTTTSSNSIAPAASTVTPAKTSATVVPAPSPTQASSIISTCNKYAKSVVGDFCSKFATTNGITAAQLYAWNSVLGSGGSNCTNNFWANYYYCVGVAS